MKHINIIILSVTIFIGGIVFLLACGYSYKVKKLEDKQKAREAFVETFNQELKNRNLDEHFLFNYDAKTLLNYELPDSVYIDDELGRHWLQLDPEKHYLNITDNINIRAVHSFLFSESPIKPDSLQLIWSEHLKESNIFIQSALCVSIMDRNGVVESNNAFQSEWYTPSNVVFRIYIGYACEIEIIGYLHYSIWEMMSVEVLLYLLLYGVCVFIIYRISLSAIAKLKSMRQIEVVQGVSGIPVRSYILHDNVLFYAEQRVIEIDGIEKKMPLQACLLLELFLNSKDHIVPDAEIMNTLWPDGSGHLKRVHKAVARLRTYLMTDSPIRIERENLDTYQLFA